MPLLSRLLIKTAFVHLFAGLLLGVVWSHPAVFHLLTVGWLTQLIFGVAYWLFPRHSKEAPFGRHRLIGVAWGMLNVGLILRVTAEPRAHDGAWGGVLVASALLQAAASLLFVVYFWSRVRTK
jgi:hypothetical protein